MADLLAQKEELVEREGQSMAQGRFQEAHEVMQELRKLDQRMCQLRGAELEHTFSDEQEQLASQNDRELEEFNQQWEARLQQQDSRAI